MLSNRDAQLKKERGYHGKSYVRPDGSECLLDKRDWDKRKQELYARAKGKCEYSWKPLEGYENRVRCSADGAIPAHYPNARHPVRDDRLTNLLLLCKGHDKLLEPQGWRKPRFGEGSKPIQKRLGGKA